MELEAKLKEIEAKGEQDRLTEELKFQYELQLKYVDLDVSALATNPNDDAAKNRLAEITENNKREVEAGKLDLERQKLQASLYNSAADREVQREKMKNDLAIAKTNKNKYDKK